MKTSPKKIRADQLLVQKGLAPTRTKAQSLIMAGAVFSGTERIEKPSALLPATCNLKLKGKDHPYVGRGGVKLKAALDHFKISVNDKICIDVGASTGGFTDCLLKEGAKKVYAIDVGYGQLDWSLQKDARVVVMDRINFRHFDVNLIKEPIDLITIDVSFISLTKIIPKAHEVIATRQRSSGGEAIQLADSSQTTGLPASFAEVATEAERPFRARDDTQDSPKTLIALIKPQFEVGKGEVGKGGIVKDEKKQNECVKKIKRFCEKNGFEVKGTVPSPISGQDGNKEFLLVAVFPDF